MIPRFCPSCGEPIPIVVSEDDIAEAVEEQAHKTAERVFTTWTIGLPDPYPEKDKDIA